MINLSGNYNLTELVAVDSFSEGVKFVNDSVNGLFMGGLLIVIFLVMLLAMVKNEKMGFEKGIMYSGALTLMMSFPLWIGGFVSISIIIVLAVLTILGIILVGRK